MTASRRSGAAPILVLAAGVIVSTLVAWLLSRFSWFALLGPAIMALALIAAGSLTSPSDELRRRAVRGAILLGALLLLASVTVVATDPSRLAMLMPILGGGTATVVVTSSLRRSSS